MSAAKQQFRQFAILSLSFAFGMMGWLLIAPICALLPRRRDWIAVIGAADGQFRDNAKYFFLQAGKLAPGRRIVFITERMGVITLGLRDHREIMRYPSFKAVWFLLRCNVAVVDESSWFRHARRFVLAGAHIVQLWHGVGCKRIELDRWRHETGSVAWASRDTLVSLRLLVYKITGRWAYYAAVACTSRFYRDEVFRPALRARNYPITGYPRNDFALSLEDTDRALAWSNVDATVRIRIPEWQKFERRLVIVAPTFRDSGSLPMQLGESELCAIDAFAETHGVEFLFKFHPSERNTDHLSGRHFRVCARDSDIYPVLPYTAALVTDYSSISMDYLLVDKPLLFLIPADDNYAAEDRQLQFDPRTMMPGPIVPDWPSLLHGLLAEWAHDKYAQARAELRRKAFDDLPQSEAVRKLLDLMREQGWINCIPICDKR